MRASDLFDWPDSLAVFRPHFNLEDPPWTWLEHIATALEDVIPSDGFHTGEIPEGVKLGRYVVLGEGVELPPACVIQGPAWIGPECKIRPNAYIRGAVITGRGCILGNSCEYKNCLLLDEVETPHYNYVGDSILGNKAHLGAGAICANLKIARDEVAACTPEGRVPTGRRKLGAILGDGAESGCNAVLQPGTILGKRAAVLTPSFHGYLPANTMAYAKIKWEGLPRPD